MTLFAASTSYAAVIRPLQLLIMVVAVLFFARVLRVASVQSRSVEVAPARIRRRAPRVLGLEFLEPEDRAGERVDVEFALTIGRSSDCDVSLDDTYLSSRHARFSNDEGDLSVEDLGSTNGTYVNEQLIKGRVHLSRGDIVQAGGVLFEVAR